MWEELNKLMTDGGPVMWPLAAMSLLGMSIAIRELGRYLFRGCSADADCLAGVLEALASGKQSAALDLCTGRDPVSRLFRKRLREPDVWHDLSEEAFFPETSGTTALAVLATIAGVAPLMGILGTVLGIVHSFAALGGLEALQMTAVASGISQALISTAAGLVVSLCALVPHNLLALMQSRRDLRTARWLHRLESVIRSSGRRNETLS